MNKSDPNEVYSRHLDDSLESLDYAIQLKLKQARETALDQHSHKSPAKVAFQWGLPSAVAAALVVVVTQQSLNEPEYAPSQSVMLADLDLLAADEELEFIENLEFYEWLEAQQNVELES